MNRKFRQQLVGSFSVSEESARASSALALGALALKILIILAFVAIRGFEAFYEVFLVIGKELQLR